MRSTFILIGLTSVVLGAACSADNTPGLAAGCTEGQLLDGRGNCINVCTSNADCNDPALECSVATGLCIPVSRACSPERPCEPGKECNSFGECVDPTVYTCDNGGTCPDGFTCNAGTCEPTACVETLCPQGFTCPPTGAASIDCVPIDGYCGSDSDCEFGERCDNGTCASLAGNIVETCITDAECGLGMTCQFGVCIGCITDLQCGEGRCVLGTCVIAELPPAVNCLTANCQDGQRCNPLNGVCETPCTANEDCGTDASCLPVAGICIDYRPCEDDGDCQGNLTCAVGLCLGCNSGEPCPAGTTCQFENPLTGGGACIPDLESSLDPCADVTCGGGQLCDPYDGSCYNENGTCQDADDCRPGHNCSFLGFCAGCSADGDCRPGQHCRFGTCSPL